MDGQRELCRACGFDSERWRVRDASNFMDALGWWWRNALAGLDQAEAARRPAPAVWSPLEYGVHSSFVTAVLGRAMTRVLAGGDWPTTDPVDPRPADASPEDEPLPVELDQMLDDLEREGRNLAVAALAAGPDDWGRTADVAGRERVRADGILFHAVHDASHHQMDVARGLSAVGLGAVRASDGRSGRLAQINTSAGGVPKRPVESVDVGWDGLASDRQSDEKHHGQPFQAVCLWSTDAVADLAAAGHHVFAGSVGENFTVEGLDWTTLRAGARLRVGSTLLELSFPAVPCQKQAQWFADRDFTRLAYENHPRWARWYAWVREPGAATTGDEVRIV